MVLPNYSSLNPHWRLNKDIVYLNHGSFGATPIEVLERQHNLQMEMEAEAVAFLVDRLPEHIHQAKTALASFVGSHTNDMVFVQNTTSGVNTVLNSLTANAGDEWLTTNHAYGACVHAFKHFANKNKCTVVTADIAYPLQEEGDILAAIEKSISPKTTIALIDYITSASAIIFPVKEIIRLLQNKGIKVIIDAAHAPGMVPFSIEELKPDFFVANCHKWVCSPKGSAFLYVAPEYQQQIYPLVISHYNDMHPNGPENWSDQFLWDGTHDYSAYICVKDALEIMPGFIEGGWEAIMEHNHGLVWKAASKIANAIGVGLPAPENKIGSICNIPMPDGKPAARKFHSNVKLKDLLYHKYKIEVPIFMFPAAPKQWLRISAQLYNSMEQYDYLIECLQAEGIGK